MFITPSFKKSLIVEQFQGNYLKTEFPNAGYRRVHSQLVSRGIRVSHLRVREAMHRCDPEGTAMRWLIITPRAKNCVSGPLALWHVDGNHKLIRHVRFLYYLITNYLLTKGEVSTPSRCSKCRVICRSLTITYST